MRKRSLVFFCLFAAAVLAQAGESEPFHLLVVNDDGIDAPGIRALVAELARDDGYRITVVAPAQQQSGKGSALTLRGDIILRPHEAQAGGAWWSVTATPATSVRVGIEYVLADDPPDLVLSGINKGENVGRIAWYSGTVGAARESVLRGFPAIAFSLRLDWSDPKPDFSAAARWAKPIVDAVRERPLPKGVYLNVNIPVDVTNGKGYRLCRMGLERPHVSGFEVVRRDGDALYLSGKWAPAHSTAVGSDVTALHSGFVSITPLGLDSTNYPALAELMELADLSSPSPPVAGD
jgi:5'-nucleotidase